MYIYAYIFFFIYMYSHAHMHTHRRAKGNMRVVVDLVRARKVRTMIYLSLALFFARSLSRSLSSSLVFFRSRLAALCLAPWLLSFFPRISFFFRITSNVNESLHIHESVKSQTWMIPVTYRSVTSLANEANQWFEMYIYIQKSLCSMLIVRNICFEAPTRAHFRTVQHTATYCKILQHRATHAT